MSMDEFEWDDHKEDLNLMKHGIDFVEAVSIWLDHFSLELLDTDHGTNEERWIRLGFSRKARLLVVVYMQRKGNGRIRLISARKATRVESMEYNKGKL